MSTVLINEVNESEYTYYVEATVGKTSAYVSMAKRDRSVNVCCKNASHRVWRGIGKIFGSFAEARENYRSAAMKTIIDTAEEIITEKLTGEVKLASD